MKTGILHAHGYQTGTPPVLSNDSESSPNVTVTDVNDSVCGSTLLPLFVISNWLLSFARGLLMFCKPYDNIPFKKESEEYRRCYDEKEWIYIGLCDSIFCFNKDRKSLRKFIKETKDAQDKIMEKERTLQFTIDDITHIILPTEEKKEEFINTIEKIEEYEKDIDKTNSLVIIKTEKIIQNISKNEKLLYPLCKLLDIRNLDYFAWY